MNKSRAYNKEILEYLISFLSAKGWEKHASNYKALNIFQKDDFQFLIPNKFLSSSIDVHLDNAFSQLAEYYGTEQQKIYERIKHLNWDLHKIRVDDQPSDSVRFDLAEQILSSTRVLIERGAELEYKRGLLNFKKQLKKVRKKEIVNEIIEKCQFAHTWKGSFGFTVEVPLYFDFDILLNEDKNFGRNVSKRITKGLKVLEEGTKKKSVDFIVENSSEGFDSKMFSAFYLIQQKLNSNNLYYILSWSPLYEVSEELKDVREMNFNERSFSYASDAATQLRKSEDIFDIDFVGFPKVLKAEKEAVEDEELVREIKIFGVSNKTQECTITFSLKKDDYYNAILAHQKGKNVQVKCRVQKTQKGRSWEVLKIHEFNILP